MKKDNRPVFIHSLFRSGSTYVFNVFRRSISAYWCYQESIHEIAIFAKDDSSILLTDHGQKKVAQLRHPEMMKGYFQELLDTWECWRHVITEPMVYDAYFGSTDESDLGVPYWRALIEAAKEKGRPIFQECRTSNRIADIKQSIDAHHIFLWRNPWDQWWSYKVASYFDSANQLIIHSSTSPDIVKILCSELQLEAYPNSDISGAFYFYSTRPLTSEQSYLVFYLLWILALKHALDHADLMINIDRLSSSAEYRDEILLKLRRDIGVSELNFSDCKIPQADYVYKDEQFFLPLESRIHELLTANGWDAHELAQLHQLRNEFATVSRRDAVEPVTFTDIVDQSSRARELAIRFETELALKSQALAVTLAQQKHVEAQKELAWQHERGELLNHLAGHVEQAQTANSECERLEAEIKRLEAELHRFEIRQAESMTVIALKDAFLKQFEVKNEHLQQRLTDVSVLQGVTLAEKSLIEEQKSNLDAKLLSAEHTSQLLTRDNQRLELQLLALTKDSEISELRMQLAREKDALAAERISQKQADDYHKLKQEFDALQKAHQVHLRNKLTTDNDLLAAEKISQKQTDDYHKLKHEFEELLQVNHIHFSQLQAAQAELAQLHAANHHHWLQAEQRLKQIQALSDSWSWRLTAPLRYLGGAVLRVGTSMKAALKWPLVTLGKVLISFILGKPEYAIRLNGWLIKYCPFIYRHLRQFALHRQLIECSLSTIPPRSDLNNETLIDVVDLKLANLSPQARAIYRALQIAIETNEGKQ
ncbi:hypothetical protein [Rheinheimera sp.]|uniref:hypothetical protein n=1 Tax=Rheinheimera sp. TaxID=1869214 RepID=UPI00307D12D7